MINTGAPGRRPLQLIIVESGPSRRHKPDWPMINTGHAGGRADGRTGGRADGRADGRNAEAVPLPDQPVPEGDGGANLDGREPVRPRR